MKLRKILKRHLSHLRDDYLDWTRIPHKYGFVAIDAVDTGIWKAGVPIAYQREPTFDGQRWTRAAPGNLDMSKDIPAYVTNAAIIGVLPKPEASLRRRPV